MLSALIIAVAVLVSWVLSHDYRISALEQRLPKISDCHPWLKD